jgi:hypothetical protein
LDFSSDWYTASRKSPTEPNDRTVWRAVTLPTKRASLAAAAGLSATTAPRSTSSATKARMTTLPSEMA